MTSDFHFHILPSHQKEVLKRLISVSDILHSRGFYLAGGTALALQIGHRQSYDFDFFTQQKSISKKMYESVSPLFDSLQIRMQDEHTLHVEANTVKLSFIGNYSYRVVEIPLEYKGVRIARITDIGLMKLLAITHRATLRDYIDLAAIIQIMPLSELLHQIPKKYGASFNQFVILKALVSFDDLDDEMPVVIDKELEKNWKGILESAVQSH